MGRNIARIAHDAPLFYFIHTYIHTYTLKGYYNGCKDCSQLSGIKWVSQRQQVSRVALWGCSLNVFVFVFVFVILLRQCIYSFCSIELTQSWNTWSPNSSVWQCAIKITDPPLYSSDVYKNQNYANWELDPASEKVCGLLADFFAALSFSARLTDCQTRITETSKGLQAEWRSHKSNHL